MIGNTFWRAVIWCILSLFFGLLQLWFVIGYCALDKDLTFDFTKVLRDCGLVFFCTALVAGLALDFFANNKKRITDLGLVGLAYAFYPAVVVATATLVYSVCFRGKPDMALVRNLQMVIITMSIIYAVAAKQRAFAAR